MLSSQTSYARMHDTYTCTVYSMNPRKFSPRNLSVRRFHESFLPRKFPAIPQECFEVLTTNSLIQTDYTQSKVGHLVLTMECDRV